MLCNMLAVIGRSRDLAWTLAVNAANFLSSELDSFDTAKPHKRHYAESKGAAISLRVMSPQSRNHTSA